MTRPLRTPLRLATRGSELAMWQARSVAARLAEAHGEGTAEPLVVSTVGDRVQNVRLPDFSTTGVFTKEVDRVLLDGGADAAVHSLKDQTTTLEPGLVLAAVLPRGAVEDAFVGREQRTLDSLPAGARVATGSLRRQAQLKLRYPHLEVVEIRGNVPKRIERMRAGHAEGLILAKAGLVRLGLGLEIGEVLAAERFYPAVSQGIVAVVAREDDEATLQALARIDHAPTHAIARAERGFLRALGGGCNVPAGVLTELRRGELRLRARIVGPEGAPCLEAEGSAPEAEGEALGERLAAELLSGGGEELIAAARANAAAGAGDADSSSASDSHADHGEGSGPLEPKSP